MDRPLDEIFTTVETTRKTKYLMEKYHSSSVDMERLSRVARNLFGTPPPGEVHIIEKELDSLSALASARWDFDFRKGLPMDLPNPKYIWRRPKDSNLKKQSSQASQSSSKLEKSQQSNRITNYLCTKRKRSSDSCATTKSTTKLIKYSTPHAKN